MVFGAASAALIVATVVGVIVGSFLSAYFLSAYIDEKVLSYIAGCGFIIIGAYTLHTA
jgi:putative Ca2+/H+ antiporter (TMEM165/GDT1 family)